ncbi:MAG: DUF1559 domain-containing protein [Pirellulales bacterium]
MPIPFTCPYCGHQVMVADQYIGQTGPCARCGQAVTITSTPAIGALAPSVKHKKKGGSGAGLVIAIIGGVVLLLLLACGGFMVFGVRTATVAVQQAAVQAQGAAGRSQCMNNLRQIAIAMHNYHDVHGSLPPAYLADAEGKPMHSWRVLILPYVGQSALYQQYHFDEPWDSPHNSSLAALMPLQYRCPDDAAGEPSTHYMVISGTGAPFEGSTPAKFSSFLDGLSNTLLVVEATSSANWMSPTDLDISQMSFAVNDTSRPAVGSPHENGANVALGDGSVRFLTPEDTPPDALKAMITRGGGEPPTY